MREELIDRAKRFARKFGKATEGLSVKELKARTGIRSIGKILAGSQLPVQTRTITAMQRVMNELKANGPAREPIILTQDADKMVTVLERSSALDKMVAILVNVHGGDAVLDALVRVTEDRR